MRGTWCRGSPRYLLLGTLTIHSYLHSKPFTLAHCSLCFILQPLPETRFQFTLTHPHSNTPLRNWIFYLYAIKITQFIYPQPSSFPTMRAPACLQSHIQFELAFGKEEKPEQKPHLPQNCGILVKSCWSIKEVFLKRWYLNKKKWQDLEAGVYRERHTSGMITKRLA